jgi:hypothetical protein
MRRNIYNSWTERATSLWRCYEMAPPLRPPRTSSPRTPGQLFHRRTNSRPNHGRVRCMWTGKGEKKNTKGTQRPNEGPGYRLAVDFHDFNRGYGGFNSLMLVTDRWSGYYWDYYLLRPESENYYSSLQTPIRYAETTIQASNRKW